MVQVRHEERTTAVTIMVGSEIIRNEKHLG